jgi:hypothetical protein
MNQQRSAQSSVFGRHGQFPEQLQHYYDTAMQVMFGQETLDEIRAERAEQITRRGLLMDQDCIPGQSKEDLNRMGNEPLSGARKSINTAQTGLQTACAAYDESDIDIACWRPRSWFDLGESQETWPTSANERENQKFAYNIAWDQPGNIHTYHNDISSLGMHVTDPQRGHSSGDGPRIVRETRVPSTLNGHEISADVGAAANFIALRYVRRYGLTINPSARNFVQTAVGSAVDILGTVTLPFSFKDEEKVYHLKFNVMREAVHDVIIESPFLKLTKTYTRYKHRLQQMFREVRLPRLRFLGSHQYV